MWSRCRNLRIPLHCETDLGVILESPQGTQSSSRVGACTCDFLPRWSSIVMLPVEWIKGSVAFPRGFPTRLSHEAFPRGFPTGLSHVPPWCESILGLKVEAVQGKQVSLEWTETSGGLREWWHHPGVPLLSCGDRLLLTYDGNAGKSFLTTQGKDPSSRARRQKRGSSGCGRDSRASSRVETGMSGNFLSCSKGVKDPMEVPEVRCD